MYQWNDTNHPPPRSTSKSHLLFRTLRENVLFLGRDVRRVGERKTFVPVSHGLSFDFRACLRLRQRDLHQLLPSTEEQLPREKKHAGEESGRLWWVYIYIHILFRLFVPIAFQLSKWTGRILVKVRLEEGEESSCISASFRRDKQR